MTDIHRRTAERVTKHLRSGEVVNLGIGIPTLVADLLLLHDHVYLETEDGLLRPVATRYRLDSDPPCR